MKIYEDLVCRYGHLMYVSDIAKEMKLAVGTIRNRNQKKNLPFPVKTESQRIVVRTKDFADYLEGE